MIDGKLIPMSPEVLDNLANTASDEAYIIACETVGLNSYEFKECFTETSIKLNEKYIEEYAKAHREDAEATK